MFGCGRSGMILLAAVATIVFIVVAFLGFGSFNPYYGGYYGMMGSFGGLGMLIWIPIVLVIVVVGYFLLRGSGGWRMGVGGGGCCGGSRYGRYYSYQSRDDALAILRQRYARGEISREQFEQMRRDIDSQ